MFIYTYLGISEDKFKDKVKPFLSNLMNKGGKTDQVLLAIEAADLDECEKIYCAYEVGIKVGCHPRMHKTDLKRLMGLVLRD